VQKTLNGNNKGDNMKRLFSALVLASVLLCGCAYMRPVDYASIDYGRPISENLDYKGMIKNYISNMLFDPYSAVIEYQRPETFWCRGTIFSSIESGYMVFVDVNAKNRMGGYTGKKRWGFLFKNDILIKVIDPSEMPFINW
jgi:hypothetical protein